MSKTLITTASAFHQFTCLYLPADDPPALIDWYKELFNSPSTRKHFLFWGPKKEFVANCNFITDEYIPGETYEMFAVRFETDCIEALYERLSKAGVVLEPMQKDRTGFTFVFTDPQGNKFQVWQHPDTETQSLRDDVPALIGATTLFFPVANPEETRKWYLEVIGLELNDSGWPTTSKGQEIRFYKALDIGLNQPYHRHWSIINVAVDGLDVMHKRLLEQGQKVKYILDRGGCGRNFDLYDPDGNMLEIWEPQTMILKNFNVEVDCSDWKQHYHFANAGFEDNEPEGGDIDSFLARVSKNDFNHRRIVIPGYNVLQTLDPEGMESLLETLHQYSMEHPRNSFEIIKRDWEPTDTDAMEPADHREVFIVPTERAKGILKIYGRSDSPNWKDRIVVQIPFFSFDIDTFFSKALEGRHEIFRQIQIINDEASIPWYLKKIDSDAVRELKITVERFNQEHPEHAIDIIE
ncbi:VOC family protein [Paenibacillus thermotolerans]|uniref:VOC family protein n=1 Tax=Paenibacillus thermotolerans TaxID=3027807 RepID=UPI00236805A8|nr:MULTISPECIES: VOC family protein [unclassified Paenibacillus]